MPAVMKFMSYAAVPVAFFGLTRAVVGAPKRQRKATRPNQKAVAMSELSAAERKELVVLLEAELARV